MTSAFRPKQKHGDPGMAPPVWVVETLINAVVGGDRRVWWVLLALCAVAVVIAMATGQM